MSAPFGGAADAAAVMARPDSVPVGVVEHRIWKPFGQLARSLVPKSQLLPAAGPPTRKEAWSFVDAVLAAAKTYDQDTKMPGDRMGKLGKTGIAVLEAIFSLVDHMKGRIEPSIAAIAARAKLARGTVVRALARLWKEGFLRWVRRKVPLDNDGPGPQVHQATNAYFFELRGRAAGLVRLALSKRKPPLPDDVVAHRTQEHEATESMLDRAEAEDFVAYFVSDPALRESLARLGRSIESSAISMIGRNPDRQNK